MRYLNKFSAALSIAAFGLMGLTSCENADIYEINSPDWLANRVDSIAASKNTGGEEEELVGQMEDVYTFGKTDYTSGWWAAFSKTYMVPDGMKWQAQFNLNINPDDNTYYKNFALIVATDDRGGANYSEYGAFRYDLTANATDFNSNWGTVFGVITANNEYQYTSSNMLFAPEDNKDAGLQKMAGKVTLTIDRSDANRHYMEINNGTICKTFDMPENLAPGEDIYCFLVPEGSYIDFLSTNIEPIGGCTSREDKQPLSMELSGVPSEVLVGTSLDSAMASVTAKVEFEQMLSKTVTIADLQIEVIPDMETLGEKTLVVMYNKTWKGVASDKIIMASKKFKVVNELSAFTETYVVPATSLGADDCSTGWWSVFTDNIKIEPKETKVVSFTNYGNLAGNWNNYVLILNNANLGEYAVVRADNFGWGNGYAACAHNCAQTNDEEWAEWREAMNGAKVTMYITNKGDGTADIKALAKGTNGITYEQTYTGINTIDPDDFYFRFTVDGSYLVFDKELGTEDCSAGWWTVFTPNVKVDAHQICTVNFTNYSCGASNWNNFVLIMNREDLSEYAVVRADNYGWGNGYAACTPVCNNGGDWGAWLAAMNGAKVSMTIDNKGDGTVDVKCTIQGNDGNTYIQEYNGINTVDPDDFYFRFTCDGSYLVFE